MFKEISEALCQDINHDKAELFFSSRTHRQFKRLVQNAININHYQSLNNCLGLFSLIGRNKSTLVTFIEEWAKNRIQGWKYKHLNKAYMEVLQYVVSVIPTYVVSCLLIQKKYVKLLIIVRKLQWGSNDYMKKIN